MDYLPAHGVERPPQGSEGTYEKWLRKESAREPYEDRPRARRIVPSMSGDRSKKDEKTRIKHASEKFTHHSTKSGRRARDNSPASPQPSGSCASPKHGHENLRAAHIGGLKCVSGSIGRHKATALSDTGAAQNCIRGQYVKGLKLKVRPLESDEPRSLVLGHGKQVQVLGAVNCAWTFAADSERVDIVLYILPDCIFDVILGAEVLFGTETITRKRYRLSPMKRSQNALKVQLVNLCGTPVRCLRGKLDATECFALPDSGAEPNLISYQYAEAKGWLLDMYPGPESCRLLQFADGSTETVSGRLGLQWSFLTGWDLAEPGAPYFDFEVLRGCPFDVILGCGFLDETQAFTMHMSSIQEIVNDSLPGMNIVVWVKSKLGKRAAAKMPTILEDQERERQRRERDAEFERRAKAAWPSDANQWYYTHGNTRDLNSPPASIASGKILRHTYGDVGVTNADPKSPSATE